MTKKKKEILDNLELPTSEVEERKFKEFVQEGSDKQAEFYYESKIIPANLLREPLEDSAIFFNILIEMLDPDYHYNNKFESFKEKEPYHSGMISHAFKNIKVEHIGDERDKQFLLEMLSDLITHLDYARIKLFITDEQAERKAGDVVFKRWEEYQKKKQQKEDEEKKKNRL